MLKRSTAAALVCVGLTASVQAQTFDVITAPPGQGIRARGISADGTVVAGELTGLVNAPQAFTWTRSGGRVDLGTAQGFGTGSTTGLSGDGTTLVGLPAFRYRGPGTYQSLGTTSGLPNAWAYGVNHDGNVIVGEAFNSSGTVGVAWRWTPSGGMQSLGRLPGHSYSSALAVSRDGNVTVGWSGGGTSDAFAWTASGGMTALPANPGSLTNQATAINHDGSYIAGTSGFATIWHAGVATPLPHLSGWAALIPHGISDDGTVVAGQARNPSFEQEAWVWTQGRGSESLLSYLLSLNVPIPSGWRLNECKGISADGRTFIGVGGNLSTGDSGAFVATVPGLGTIVTLALGAPFAARRRRAST